MGIIKYEIYRGPAEGPYAAEKFYELMKCIGLKLDICSSPESLESGRSVLLAGSTDGITVYCLVSYEKTSWIFIIGRESEVIGQLEKKIKEGIQQQLN